MAIKRTNPRESAPAVRSGKDSAPGGTRRLPPEFDRLAAGDDRLPRRPRPQDARVRDVRERVLIPGTNNRDSRHVYDARLSQLRRLMAKEARAELGQDLLEFSQLGLYRARNVVDMDAFTTSVLGLTLDEAQALVSTAAEAAGQKQGVLADPVVALWLRTEAALREHLQDAQVRMTGTGDQAQFQFALPCAPIAETVDALCGVGRQAAGLGRHLAGPSPSGDPRGTPRDRRPTIPQRPPFVPRRSSER